MEYLMKMEAPLLIAQQKTRQQNETIIIQS